MHAEAASLTLSPCDACLAPQARQLGLAAVCPKFGNSLQKCRLHQCCQQRRVVPWLSLQKPLPARFLVEPPSFPWRARPFLFRVFCQSTTIQCHRR